VDGALEQAQYLELRIGEKKGIKEMEKRRREMGTTPQPPPHSLLGHFTPMQSLLGTYRIFFGFFFSFRDTSVQNIQIFKKFRDTKKYL